MNDAVERQHRVTKEYRIGNQRLVALSDGHIVMDQRFIGTPSLPTAGHDAIRDQEGQVILPIGCFLLIGERIVLIDAGFGPHGSLGQSIVGGELPLQLEHLGVAVSDIDVIALTHLHEDHVGWLANTDGSPVFTNATVHVGAADWQHFVDGSPDAMPLPQHIEATLRGLASVGRVMRHDGDAEIIPSLTRIAAPGHTPGHAAFLLHDGTDRLLLVGDAFYCGQQLTATQWGAATDGDPDLALTARNRILEAAQVGGALVLGSHFPGLEAVHPN